MKTSANNHNPGTLQYSACRLLLFSMLLMVHGSCSKEDFSPDLSQSPWTPELAFPLVYTEIGVSDLAQVNDSSTTLVVDANQFCTLIYQSRVFELAAWQLVQVPDQVQQGQFSLNSGQILTYNNSGQVQATQTQDINFSVSQGIEIDSMILKGSELIIDMNSDFPSDAAVRVTIPGLVKAGSVFSEIIQLNNSGGTSVTGMRSVPLDDYHIDLTKNGSTHNTLEVQLSVSITGNGGTITPSNRIAYSISFRDISYRILYGYMGQQNIANIPDSLELSIFNNAIGTGNFTVAEPAIRFDIHNSLGIPFQARISQLTAMNNNQTNLVVATGIPDPLPVNSPTINQTGQTIHSNFILDNGNSNINLLIAEQPKYLTVQSQVNTNPAGPAVNFVTDSSRLAVDMHVELPLFGTASDFRIRDTVPFNYNDLEQVETLMLRMNVENWFPLETSVQLIFTDENYFPLDTLFLPGEVVIPSGVISSGDRVTIAGTKIRDHLFDKNRIDKILTAKNIFIDATASTYQQGNVNVKIFNDYKLKVKIGAIAKLKIQ